MLKKEDLKIPEFVSVRKLRLNDDNPRTITTEKFNKLCDDIRRFPKGMGLKPIVYRSDTDFTVMCGNMRLRACTELGWQEIPAVSGEGMTDEEMKYHALKNKRWKHLLLIYKVFRKEF